MARVWKKMVGGGNNCSRSGTERHGQRKLAVSESLWTTGLGLFVGGDECVRADGISGVGCGSVAQRSLSDRLAVIE